MNKKFNYSPCLFCTDEGESFTFVIKPCEEKEQLRALVEYGGGDVVSTPCETGVVFIPPNVGFYGDDEVYSTEYIRDCCAQNSVLDLRPYRLNKRSLVPEELDVREILCKRKTWSDTFASAPKTAKSKKFEQHHDSTRYGSVFKKSYVTASVEESDSSSDGSEVVYVTPKKSSEDEASDAEESITNNHFEVKRGKLDKCYMKKTRDQKGDARGREVTKKANCYDEDLEQEELDVFPESSNTRRMPPRKLLYTEAERKAILNYIVSRKLVPYVKGNEIWKKMEVSKVCPGRSWQSLKEHFRKYILENLDKYDLPNEVVKQLKT